MTIEQRGRVRIERGAKRVRGLIGGVTVFDTTEPTLVWEGPHVPVYYVPAGDVAPGVLLPSTRTERSPSRGTASFWSLQAGDRLAEDAVRGYPDSPFEDLRGLLRFDWAALDTWLEEDEEVFTHARDPHHRIDILRSSRHVEVLIDGLVVADSRRPTVLFETGMPPRFYLPMTDLRADLLRSTPHATSCPYKGTASYWSMEIAGRVHENIVWTYPLPLPEGARIAGLACFYNERVELRIDGTSVIGQRASGTRV